MKLLNYCAIIATPFLVRISVWFVVAIMVFTNSQLFGAETLNTAIVKTNTENDSENENDDVLAGHSYHGESFNEGQRQFAYLIGETGQVNFNVTTSNPEAQKFINQGLAQIYGFWFLEAERSFRHAATLDPNCAMAHWGAAMATQGDKKRAVGFIRKAMGRREKVSQRERDYIMALSTFLEDPTANSKKNKTTNKKTSTSSKVNKKLSKEDKTKADLAQKTRAKKYITALERIVHEYPDDLEARALLVFQLYENHRKGLPIQSYFAVDALMDGIFEQVPLHPVHHFRIHLWDKSYPERALKSAAICGQSAPKIAHMWHMPGHTFSRLKRFEDAALYQEAAARVDHAYMMRDGLMPDQIHNFAHNNEWLIQNMIKVGRVEDGIALAKNMLELPRHPKYNTLAKRGSARYGHQRLLEVLVKYQRWDELITLSKTSYLESSVNHDRQVERLKSLAAAYYVTGDAEAGKKERDTLTKMLDAVRQDLTKSNNKQAEAKSKATGKKSEKATDRKDKTEQERESANKKKLSKKELDKKIKADPKVRNLTKAINLVDGYAAFAKQDYDAAVQFLKKGGASKSFISEVMFLGKDKEKAFVELEKELKKRKNEVLPTARHVYLLHKNGEIDEAKKAFEKLRHMSGSIDMKSILFTRLNPIAKEFGLPSDWRIERTIPEDVGEVPAYDSLGPIHWKPSAAPDWKLPGLNETKVSFSDNVKGKPTILIFYLGYGCIHCAEQLHEFSPEMPKFKKAGIDVIAISSDEVIGLQVSLEEFKGKLNFPLLADGERNVFKKYRAYDDFEDLPLHGTYLIDKEGKIRWQDISYEPFMEPAFLLKEAKRLLAQ